MSRSYLSKSDKYKERHIVHILRNDPRRFRIIAFAEALAATKIQRHYRDYTQHKIECERIRFEEAK